MQKKKLTDHLIIFGQNIARIGFKSTIKYTLNGFNKKGNFTIKPKHYKYPIMLRCNVIPESRTTVAYIKRLGEGIGMSERLRTLKISKISYLQRLISEIMKWIASFFLFFCFLFTFKSQKGTILLIFRWNVTKGLLLPQ